MHRRNFRIVAAGIVVAWVQTTPTAPGAEFSRTFETLRLRILSSQLTATISARAEWGFGALVEADDVRLLFDTGNLPDTVTANARALNVDLRDVRHIVLSHWHGDHTGGIESVLDTIGARETRIHAHPRIFDEKFRRGSDTQINGLSGRRAAIEKRRGVFQLSAEPREVIAGMVLTGGVPRRDVKDQKLADGTAMREGGTLVTDTVPDEQSLVINTRDGLVIVTGCGHAGVVNTVEYVHSLFPNQPIAAVVGGFHWFASPEADVLEAAKQLKQSGVSRLMGAHCTMMEPMIALRQHGWTRDAAQIGAVGADFELRPSAATASVDPAALRLPAVDARSFCHVTTTDRGAGYAAASLDHPTILTR